MIRTVAKQAALGTQRATAGLLLLDALGLLRKQGEDDVLDRGEFTRRFTELATALRITFRRDEARALDRIAEVLDVDWPTLNEVQRAKVLRDAADVLRGLPVGLRGRTLDRVQAAAIRMERRARVAARREFGLNVPARPPRARIEAATAQSRLTPDFIEGEFERRANKFEEVALLGVLAGINLGQTPAQINTRLAGLTDAFVRRPDYFGGVAASVLNRARTDALLGAFAEVGVATYEVRSARDDRVCPKCWLMDGQRFSVESGTAIMGAAGKARSPRAMLRANPFLRQGRTPTGQQIVYIPGPGGDRQIVAFVAESAAGERPRFRAAWDADRLTKAGIGPPPYHPICRCGVIPVRS